MAGRLDDFTWWYCRHTGVWKWREKKKDPNAETLGHKTEGTANSKGLALADIRLELQDRKSQVETPDASLPSSDLAPEG